MTFTRIIFFVLVIALLGSVGNALWKSMNFDSKVSGYVQNAVRESPEEILQRIMEIASEIGIELRHDDVAIVPLNQGWEVTCTYDVNLGLGGFSYTWKKKIVARTRFGGVA